MTHSDPPSSAAPGSGPSPDPPGAAPRPWPHHGSEPGPDLMVCRARFDTLENPRTGRRMRRTVLGTPDWVNVIALTPEGRVVVVRQYRFGTSTVTTEIPGGVVDPGEDSGAAARRELREESGYTAPTWRYLGCVEPNPAFQNNLCHHWLAEGATRTHELELDPGEDLTVDLLTPGELVAAVAAGEVGHSLVVAALARVFDLRSTAADSSGADDGAGGDDSEAGSEA